jgi:hypothetical protein
MTVEEYNVATKIEARHESVVTQEILQPDSQYRQDLEEAHKVYGSRLERASDLTLRVTVGEFTNALLSRKEPTLGVTLYERLAGEELQAAERLAAVRLAIRQIDSKFAPA